MVVLQQMSVIDSHLEVVIFNQHLDFEWFTTFKREGRLSLFLAPDIICLCIADDDSLVVLIEAWVKVEGHIIPFLEI